MPLLGETLDEAAFRAVRMETGAAGSSSKEQLYAWTFRGSDETVLLDCMMAAMRMAPSFRFGE